VIEQTFKLPIPLSHLRAVVGSARIRLNKWAEFGVVVRLQSGCLLRLENFKTRDAAERYAAGLVGA